MSQTLYCYLIGSLCSKMFIISLEMIFGLVLVESIVLVRVKGEG